MFYGLIGIPLCIVMLAGLGGKLGELGSSLDKRLLCLAHGSAKGCKLLRLAILVSIGWTLFLMFPAVLFTLTEGWTYLDSVYFAFITLSTVGFGDVVPGIHSTNMPPPSLALSLYMSFLPSTPPPPTYLSPYSHLPTYTHRHMV